MTDILIKKQNIILDATLLSSLMACARYTDLRFNHNFISLSGKSNSLECGSIIHKFLESYYEKIIGGIRKSEAEGFAFTDAKLYIDGCPYCTNFVPFDELIKPSCGHKPNDYIGVINTPKESENHLIGWSYVLDTCQQYIDFYRNDHWVPLEVEVVKGKILYEDDDIRVMWKAKLDLVVDTNQGIYPIDHKTMKQRRNTHSMNNQFIGQCLIMNTRNVFINKIGFQKSLKSEEKFERVSLSYTASRLLEWQSETLPYYAKLLVMYNESGHYPPNFSNCDGKYGNCPFLKVCESDSGMREEEIKLNFMIGPEWNPISSNEE